MSSEQKQYPKVGIGVWVANDKNQVLMMKRQGSHGADTWAPPGGKLDMGEEWMDCIRREVKEETGLDVEGFTCVGATNDIFSPDKHFVTILVKVNSWSGEPKIMEPEKCAEMGWYDIHNLPQPLFLSIEHLFQSDFPCLCGSGKSFKECHAR